VPDERPGFSGLTGLDDLVARLVDFDRGLLFGRGTGEKDAPDDEDAAAGPSRPTRRSGNTTYLDRYGHDLTAAARAGRLDPVLERDAEIGQVVEILARRTKNNPVLLGEPGVGKTAIAEGIAARVAADEVPDSLVGCRLVALDLAGMVAGTKYRGEFEQRLHHVIDEVTADGTIVLFVDELHLLVGGGAGSADNGGSTMDAASILKPALARGSLRLLGATTTAEYRRYVEPDAAFARRLTPITVAEPSVEQTAVVLDGLAPRYETFHRVRLPDAVRRAAVELTARHVRDRFLPDKAVDAMDRAAARVRMRATGAGFVDVTVADVAAVVAESTGLPLAHLTADDRVRLLDLAATLRRRVVGQDDAVDAVADAVLAGRAGLSDPGRPLGSFLFVGPTGVGKTELARALAEALYGSDDAVVRFDMAEFAEAHTVTRLTGAPPGYVGHDRPGELTEAVRRNPSCVVLFDEVEKAHRDVVATLLGILDAGRLTDSRGYTASFADAVVIMTSNLAASELAAAGEDAADLEARRPAVLAVLRRTLRPEMLGRVDDVVLFRALGPARLREVVRLLLAGTRGRLAARGVTLALDENEDAVLDALVARAGTGSGARPLRRVVRQEVERPLARRVIAGEHGAYLRVALGVSPDGSLTLT